MCFCNRANTTLYVHPITIHILSPSQARRAAQGAGPIAAQAPDEREGVAGHWRAAVARLDPLHEAHARAAHPAVPASDHHHIEEPEPAPDDHYQPTIKCILNIRTQIGFNSHTNTHSHTGTHTHTRNIRRYLVRSHISICIISV